MLLSPQSGVSNPPSDLNSGSQRIVLPEPMESFVSDLDDVADATTSGGIIIGYKKTVSAVT